MLAYSSIAQIGYLMLGVGMVSVAGLTASLVHMLNHALIKTALFLAVGSIFRRLGSVELEDMRGLGRRMPWTMAAFVLAGLGLIGVPLTAGFISKWYLVLAAVEQDRWLLAGLVLLASLIAVVYIWRVVEAAYFQDPPDPSAKGAEAPLVHAGSPMDHGGGHPLLRGLDFVQRRHRRPRRGDAAGGNTVNPAAVILAAVALPLLAAPAIVLLGSRPNLRETATLIGAALTFLAVAALAPGVVAGARPAVELGVILPGLALGFEVEPLGLLFALVASGLWILTSLYSIGYMRSHREENQTRFFAFFALAIGAALSAAFAANLLTLFISYEVLTLSTYPLVTHHRSPEARRSGRVYMGILLGTSIGFLLPALVWTWHLAGTLDFAPGGILSAEAGRTVLCVLLGLYAFGTGKAALMPFHRWLPAAMVAPTPVSALLHAVAVVKAGVFTVMKVAVYVFGVDLLAGTGASLWLLYAAAATILAASLVALTRDNLKARLGLFHHQPAGLRGNGGGSGQRLERHRRQHAHSHARGGQNHPVFLRRSHIRGPAQNRGQRHGRHRQNHAGNHDRVRAGRAECHRHPAVRGLLEQMVPGPGSPGSASASVRRRAGDQLPAQPRLPDAAGGAGLLRPPCRPGRRSRTQGSSHFMSRTAVPYRRRLPGSFLLRRRHLSPVDPDRPSLREQPWNNPAKTGTTTAAASTIPPTSPGSSTSSPSSARAFSSSTCSTCATCSTTSTSTTRWNTGSASTPFTAFWPTPLSSLPAGSGAGW